MKTLACNTYTANIEIDGEDEIFFGRIAAINDVIGFHAERVAELKLAFHEAVDDYIKTCRLAGKAPEKPYSGKVMFRIPAEVHAQAALAAEVSGLSLNQWAEAALRSAAHQTLQRAESQ